MNSRAKEHFILNDVARAGEDALVQKSVAHHHFGFRQQFCIRDSPIPLVRHDVRFPVVGIVEITFENFDGTSVEVHNAIFELQGETRRTLAMLVDAIRSKKHQVNPDCEVGEADEKVLSPSPKVDDRLADCPLNACLRISRRRKHFFSTKSRRFFPQNDDRRTFGHGLAPSRFIEMIGKWQTRLGSVRLCGPAIAALHLPYPRPRPLENSVYRRLKDMLTKAKRQTVIRIGTAGWNIPKDYRATFEGAGTYLQRYAKHFNAVEINSSFYRPHRTATYARWAASVPADFQFSVKTPKAITHELRLRDCSARIEKFFQEITGLGAHLGCVLVQLPPSLQFDANVAGEFFESFRACFRHPLICEPRHATWFTNEADGLMRKYRVGRVAADPPVNPDENTPGGCTDLQYFRLHGSPKTYYSSYSAAYLKTLAANLLARSAESAAVWCVFDNTAQGFATCNALELQGDLPDPAGESS
jgi:uncharacterized protein YecE (DUF72 family)